MPTDQEKEAFAQRLRLALNQFALRQLTTNPMARPIKGGVGLARHFNLKHAGGVSITPQAAHKWLNGQAIPKADKIRTLAQWLGVSEHWLHYGPAPEDASFNEQSSQSSSKYPSFTQALTLAQRIEALPERQRHLVEELIEQFYGKSPK